MDVVKFTEAYNLHRNGCNGFYRHSLVRSFHYSDGVRDCAIAGCYWLLDIMATELPIVLRRHRHESSLVTVSAIINGGKSVLKAITPAGKQVWSKRIDTTDMPIGVWKFEVTDELENGLRCILPSEY